MNCNSAHIRPTTPAKSRRKHHVTYEVQFQHEGAEYKVIGADIDGMLRLIQGVQGTEVVPEHEARRDAAEATLKGLKYEWRGGEQWVPPIGQPPAWVNEPKDPKDPHAELRKTWAPGQRWQTRVKGSTDWLHLRDDPGWHSDQEYLQCE